MKHYLYCLYCSLSFVCNYINYSWWHPTFFFFYVMGLLHAVQCYQLLHGEFLMLLSCDITFQSHFYPNVCLFRTVSAVCSFLIPRKPLSLYHKSWKCDSPGICDALRDLVPFVHFKKTWKTPMEGCYHILYHYTWSNWQNKVEGTGTSLGTWTRGIIRDQSI